MDRRVKERLVGASILVALIVLIVPELLSGPPLPGQQPALAPQPVRNVTVDLATSKAPAAEPAPDPPASNVQPTAPAQPPPTPSPDQPSRAPPAPSHSSPTAARTQPAAVETAPPAPRSTVTAARAAAAGAWAVQLGSFASRANADKLARQLKAQGFPVYVMSGGSRASTRYRVRVGPMADRGAAAQIAAKLQSLGHSASFVPPAP